MIAGRSNAVAKLARAFSLARDEAGALFTGTGVIVVTVGLGMYHLEHGAQPEVFTSVLDGLWWSVVTLTTVGYGDVYPVTAGGKILATVAMFAGIGVIGAACRYPSATGSRGTDQKRQANFTTCSLDITLPRNLTCRLAARLPPRTFSDSRATVS